MVLKLLTAPEYEVGKAIARFEELAGSVPTKW